MEPSLKTQDNFEKQFACPLRVDKGRIFAAKDFEADVSSVRPLSQGTDRGLTHETSVFQISHGVNSSIINSFDKTNFLRIILQPTQQRDFFRIYFFF